MFLPRLALKALFDFVARLKANVTWGRDPSKDPSSFVLVWVTFGTEDLQQGGVPVNVANSTVSGVTEVPYPDAGWYQLGMTEAALSALTHGPLFISDREVRVSEASGDTFFTSSGPSTVPTSASIKAIHSTELPSSTASGSESRPSASDDASQTRKLPIVPIVVGAIVGSILMLGSVVFILRCYLRKRRSAGQTPSLEIYPFRMQPSEKAISPKSDYEAAQQRTQRPEADITIHQDIGRDPDIKLAPPPDWADPEDTLPASTLVLVRNGVDGLVDVALAPATPRSAMQVFTTDELVMELNQRLQEEGQLWDVDESLPGYPESDQRRSRS
ncbi:hypothetical protein AAF712_014328 [Marasmius tenuissimus]|uniref:Transmembrane protein n=1 Tax=Marasmius tenuissimus TaxID=585030 RepID=A0ABR2ZBL2_9AGAR